MTNILNAQELPRFNGNRNEEVHLFILWGNAIKDEVNCQKIENDIEQNFEILGKYRINWSKDKIENNFMRFYNQGEKFTKVESVKNGINALQESAANIATMLGKVMDGQTQELFRDMDISLMKHKKKS